VIKVLHHTYEILGQSKDDTLEAIDCNGTQHTTITRKYTTKQKNLILSLIFSVILYAIITGKISTKKR